VKVGPPLLVPWGVTTITSTEVEGVPEGDTASIVVSLLIVNRLAGSVPKRTSVAPMKPDPVTEILVPPL
jgi:hypothetical protein